MDTVRIQLVNYANGEIQPSNTRFTTRHIEGGDPTQFQSYPDDRETFYVDGLDTVCAGALIGFFSQRQPFSVGVQVLDPAVSGMEFTIDTPAEPEARRPRRDGAAYARDDQLVLSPSTFDIYEPCMSGVEIFHNLNILAEQSICGMYMRPLDDAGTVSNRADIPLVQNYDGEFGIQNVIDVKQMIWKALLLLFCAQKKNAY